MHRYLLPVLLSVNAVTAEQIHFGQITSGKDAFAKYWQLNKEEVRRYEDYMAVAGKYRHQNTNPLTVLSMIAEDEEDRAYYANMAAAYEHNMVKREIETAWLISEAMAAYDADTQALTDKLTGIDTAGYIPHRQKTVWQQGDEWAVVVDKHCLHTECLKQFNHALSGLPGGISKRIVVKADTPLTDDAAAYLSSYPDIIIQHYDPIEHGFLGKRLNQPLHVRNRTVIADATAASSPSQGEHHE